MKVSELNEALSKYIERGHGDDEVVILLQENSMGASAAEAVDTCEAGFDWDSGRILLVPAKPLLHYDNERDKAQSAVRISYRNNCDGKIKPTLHCPQCETKLRKDMRYCPRCGRKVDTTNVRNVTL